MTAFGTDSGPPAHLPSRLDLDRLHYMGCALQQALPVLTIPQPDAVQLARSVVIVVAVAEQYEPGRRALYELRCAMTVVRTVLRRMEADCIGGALGIVLLDLVESVAV